MDFGSGNGSGGDDVYGAYQSYSPGCQSVSNSNSDNEDSLNDCSDANSRNRRRALHAQSEQKRREKLKKGFDALLPLVQLPPEEGCSSSPKMSKATILHKTCRMLERQSSQLKQKEAKLDKLRKDVAALKIINAKYEDMLKTSQESDQHTSYQVPDEVKFQIFVNFADKLFESYDSNTDLKNFALFSSDCITWLETHCKPQTLMSTMNVAINEVGLNPNRHS